ncbi:MAG: hypothetical protein Q7W30_02020 [Coriobacteriia bacterium]|nr:hypothetical protein [Coriobacteriia bacterium]
MFRVAQCAVGPQTVFTALNYRKPASGLGGVGQVLGAYEGNIVSVRGPVSDGAIISTEVSLAPGVPLRPPWASDETSTGAARAIPNPFPPGVELEVGGSVVLGDLSSSGEGAAYLGVLDGPLGADRRPTRTISRIQYFLVDSSTTLVDGSVRRRVTAADIERLYVDGPPSQQVTARLVATSDAVYAREIVLR